MNPRERVLSDWCDRVLIRGAKMVVLNLLPPPMVLFHSTPKKFLPRIRREGLKPHVPGDVWGLCDPRMTHGKPVVWLTADPRDFNHSKHPQKDSRNPDVVLLVVGIDWTSPELKHYLSWRDPRKRDPVRCNNNMPAWFVHFGRIKPSQILWEFSD